MDIPIPNKYEGMDSHLGRGADSVHVQAMVPVEHLDFAKKILADHGVPIEDADGYPLNRSRAWNCRRPNPGGGRFAPEGDADRECARYPPGRHGQHIHDSGRKVAAPCGSPSQPRKHAEAGVDIIIAQGGEAGGHSGEVGSIVLWPQVVKQLSPHLCWPPVASAVASRSRAALALGSQGAWSGSHG